MLTKSLCQLAFTQQHKQIKASTIAPFTSDKIDTLNLYHHKQGTSTYSEHRIAIHVSKYCEISTYRLRIFNDQLVEEFI